MKKGNSLRRPVLLDSSHHVDDFCCGVAALDIYLKRFACINNQNSSARTYAALRGNRVVGYYTLTPGSVARERVPERIGKGLAQHPVPVIILARLAVDQQEQGIGLGKALVRDALLRIFRAAELIGGRAVFVHAKNEDVKAFYTQFRFEPSPVDPFQLFLLLKDVRKTLAIELLSGREAI